MGILIYLKLRICDNSVGTHFSCQTLLINYLFHLCTASAENYTGPFQREGEIAKEKRERLHGYEQLLISPSNCYWLKYSWNTRIGFTLIYSLATGNEGYFQSAVQLLKLPWAALTYLPTPALYPLQHCAGCNIPVPVLSRRLGKWSGCSFVPMPFLCWGIPAVGCTDKLLQLNVCLLLTPASLQNTHIFFLGLVPDKNKRRRWRRQLKSALKT